MTNLGANFNFELSTGVIYAEPSVVAGAEAQTGPRALQQLLVLGRLAVSAEVDTKLVEPGAHTTDIVPMHELLQPVLFNHSVPGKYSRVETAIWEEADFIEYGQWLDGITHEEGHNRTRLSESVLARASRLGIGPTVIVITSDEHFGSLNDYYTSLDVTPNRNRNEYDSWDEQAFADYAEKVYLELKKASDEGATGPDLSLNREINRRAKKGLGPSTEIFKTRGGWPMKFMALNGYIDVASMEPPDYIQWGIKFMEANEGNLPTMEAVDLLSKTRRAPGSRSFTKRFTTWGEYIGEVESAFAQKEAAIIKQKLVTIKKEVEEDRIPQTVFNGSSAKEIITIRAKWLLVNELFPKLTTSHKKVIAQHVQIDKLREVLMHTGDVDKNDIEAAAEQVGVAEDLWPSMPHLDYLKVPKNTLAHTI